MFSCFQETLKHTHTQTRTQSKKQSGGVFVHQNTFVVGRNGGQQVVLQSVSIYTHVDTVYNITAADDDGYIQRC